jgi:hypothetical protein
LDAREAAGTVTVTWDRSAAGVLHATRGILTVDNGRLAKTVELTPAQIHGGVYAYSPAGSNLLFRLALYGDGLQASGDSVRLERIGEPAAPGVTAEAQRKPPAEVDAPEMAQPPVATHEVQPVIPSGVRARIDKRLVIQVEVLVNQDGKVTEAVPQRGSDGVFNYLAEEAAAAARQWRFSPARSRDGRTVVASKTLHFVFTGK